jgi:signal transduction histidine kinase/ActR/RegA family two-component response regulator
MAVNSSVIHRQRHVDIGVILQRDATTIINRWCQRAVKEQPHAQRVHDAALRDHLPVLLQAIGCSLVETDEAETDKHCRPADKHGNQRWETGWSLTELVRDYEILRYVVVEYLEEALDRPLQAREVMALGLALDEAIGATISAYVRNREEYVQQVEQERAGRAQDVAKALQEANRRKDEFLAVLGHELRNPLGPIRNALHVLSLQGGDPAMVEWARHLMERQVQHMTHLVDDLLDVTRIAQGKITLRRERVDLVRLVRDGAEDRRGSLTEAGLDLVLELFPEPLWVEADSTRLAQVVGNLLQNAVKFTDPGGRVTVRLAPEPDGRRLMISVRDTGIGIEASLLPRLFDTFIQGDRSRGRSQGGLGLGLALVKGLTELHGGEVQAFSGGIGQGAEFTLLLPWERSPTGSTISAAQRAPNGPKLRILFIEDNRDAAESQKVLLELCGHQVSTASSGPAGLEAARQEKPDVILCDIGLPGMDGFAVAAELHREPATAAIPLIAVSGHGSDVDLQRCREAGFDQHLIKPVDPLALQQMLTTLRAKMS